MENDDCHVPVLSAISPDLTVVLSYRTTMLDSPLSKPYPDILTMRPTQPEEGLMAMDGVISKALLPTSCWGVVGLEALIGWPPRLLGGTFNLYIHVPS